MDSFNSNFSPIQNSAGILIEKHITVQAAAELSTGGDNPTGFSVQIIESAWADILTKLLMEGNIMIPESQ